MFRCIRVNLLSSEPEWGWEENEAINPQLARKWNSVTCFYWSNIQRVFPSVMFYLIYCMSTVFSLGCERRGQVMDAEYERRKRRTAEERLRDWWPTETLETNLLTAEHTARHTHMDKYTHILYSYIAKRTHCQIHTQTQPDTNTAKHWNTKCWCIWARAHTHTLSTGGLRSNTVKWFKHYYVLIWIMLHNLSSLYLKFSLSYLRSYATSTFSSQANES